MFGITIELLAALALGGFATPSLAQESEWSRPDIDTLVTELVLELNVSIGPVEVIGESDAGRRQFIPITGGSFEGKGLRGDVLDGGADWQLVRPDGVIEIQAIYAIRTDDGQVISIENRGLIDPTTGGYFRTSPEFHAPQGDYEWLNRRIFTGTVTPAPEGGAVIVRVFQVL